MPKVSQSRSFPIILRPNGAGAPSSGSASQPTTGASPQYTPTEFQIGADNVGGTIIHHQDLLV
jgi:hypothetical protein